MKDVLSKYLNKEVVLIIKRAGTTDWFIDCTIKSVYDTAVEIYESKTCAIQIIPFASIVRVEVKS